MIASEDLIEQVKSLVAAGDAESQNLVVEEALGEYLAKVRIEKRRAKLREAAGDPRFMEDLRKVHEDFRYADDLTEDDLSWSSAMRTSTKRCQL